MQFPQATGRTQLSLFQRAILANPPTPVILDTPEPHWPEPAESFSELALRGSTDNCLLLLAPILRDLSQTTGERWLTLIDAPSALSHRLRRTGCATTESIVNRFFCCNLAEPRVLSNWPAKHCDWAAAIP